MSSLCHSEVSATHTLHVVHKQGYSFPLECFPYIGRILTSIYPWYSKPLLPHGHTSLAQLVSSSPSASSLYHNPIWSSGAMPTSGSYVQNPTSQPIVHTTVTSIPMQPTNPNPLILSFQPIVSSQVCVISLMPPVSGQVVPLPGGTRSQYLHDI